MRKILVLLLVLFSVATFGQGEVLKQGQSGKILKSHYPWEYNEPADWINIHYCPKDEILYTVTDSVLNRLFFYCSVYSSGKYIVEVYGGIKADSLMKKSIMTTGYFDYTYPIGYGKHYGNNGYTQYKVRIYPELKTKKIYKYENGGIIHSILLMNINANLTTLWISSKYSAKCPILRYANLYGCYNLTDCGQTFYGASKLHTVTFPKTLNYMTTMGYHNSLAPGMFSGCTSLHHINFPDSLPNLVSMQYSFSGCTSLVNVKMPLSMNKVTSFYQAFYGCIALKQIQFPKALPKLGDMYQTFGQCSSLVYVRMPELSSLAGANMDGIFARCVSLQSVNLSGFKNVTSFAGWFPFCSSLTEIKLPNAPNVVGFGSHGIIEFDLGTFKGCTNIRKITFPDSVSRLKSMYAEALYGCTNLDTLIYFRKADSLVTFSTSILTLVSLDTITTCIFGNSMVDWQLIVKDIKTFKQPTLRVSKLILRGNTLATKSNLHTINIDWTNSTYGGTSPQIDIRWNSLSATTLDAIFTALPVVVGKTINVAGNPGSATCTPSIASLKGWTVIIL